MITPPDGWTVERTEDGILLAPPEGPDHAILHYAEHRRPIRRAIDLVRAARVPPAFVPDGEPTAPQRLVTIEGEHAALVTRAGGLEGTPAVLVYGYVFLDEHYAALEGIALADHERTIAVARDLVIGDVHLLGRTRRRRYVYEPPPDWLGTGDVFVARWYPQDYPNNPARVLVNPALPYTPGLERGILDRLLTTATAAEPPVKLTTRTGLDGEHHALRVNGVDAHLFLLHDEDFLYSVRADAAFDVGRALVESIEPIPRTDRPPAETLSYWVD